ncbi:Deoxyribonuclease-2-alpha [Trichinella pseudospiralis]|uniref:Deoxyribonuclease-2-alpha n=1 Tax=Trichinella pseudospiralis TaxID=6337 RepID=A0A0V1F6M4_TRIPS|nr:Deoxyribonuclease-2-alpha [Trichinella pseudospiralis]
MLFTTVIVIMILLKNSAAQIAICKDDGNGDLDWFLVYKPPNLLNTKIIKSERNPTWAAINRDAGHSITTTMAHFIANNANINVLAYSDDPPNLPPRNEKSKAKGVLLVDNRVDDAAAWFVHTVPNFLAYLGGYAWPAAETASGHMFLCLSLNEAHLNSVAKAIRYQEPYIYANNMPAAILGQHIELSNLATGVEIRTTPFLEHAKFTTKASQVAANIQAFGKHTKSFADMYAKVLRNKLSASIRIWAPSDARSKSICKGQYQLRKVASPMQLADSQVSREADSAKWALVEGKNTVCFTTNDYKMSEKQIPGAAVCLENAGVYTAFTAAAFNMLFTVATVILISLKTCMTQVATCKDDGNRDLDWFFNVLNTKIIKSERNPAWADSGATIDQRAGHSIVLTMAHYVQNHAEIKVLAYSDDPPNLPPRNEKSKAKGVLLVDNRVDDAAAWFVHTVPKFLAHLGGYSWPAAETAKGHMFLCVSFTEAHLNSIAKAIRYQEPYIYANNLPDALLSQHIELSNLATGVEIRITPFLEHAKFTTKAAHAAANIQAFGKHSKSFADMYARILRNKFAANIRLWAHSDARSKSICKGQYQLRKIASPMQLAGSQISREADNAKWALLEGKNTVCFTTNDYKISEKQIPGAAICLENVGVYNAFIAAAFNVEACNK